MTTEATTDYFGALLARVQQIQGPPQWDLLERAATEYPTDPRPLVLLGANLVNAGLVDVAEAAYVIALQRAPDFWLARFQLGLLQLTSGRPAAAMATWAPLEQLGEGDPLCLFKRGMEALTFDRFEDARRWLIAGKAANTTNEPLNRDMQMVIDRLVESKLLPVGAPTAATETTPAAPDRVPAAPADVGGEAAPDADDGSTHFLVSSYGQRS
jgi:tetratricopeptide (TPR) repeat protein